MRTLRWQLCMAFSALTLLQHILTASSGICLSIASPQRDQRICMVASHPRGSSIHTAHNLTAFSRRSKNRLRRPLQIAAMSFPKGGSYSVWVTPKGDLAQRLQQNIDRLAADQSAPSFVPHVTLMGGSEQAEEDALRIAEDLAASIKSYTIQLDDVSYGSIFHQCVYIRCNPTEATVAAARQARGAFGLDPAAHYMPHLSLLYSDIQQDERAAIASREQERLFDGRDAALPQVSFEAGSIELWYTLGADKSLKSWRLVKEFPLS